MCSRLCVTIGFLGSGFWWKSELHTVTSDDMGWCKENKNTNLIIQSKKILPFASLNMFASKLTAVKGKVGFLENWFLKEFFHFQWLGLNSHKV